MSFCDDISSNILRDELNENIPNYEQNSDDDENKEENNEAAPIKVLPKKRVVQNPKLRLTVDVLKGKRGLHTIENYFKNIKFKGKGYEKHDLDVVLKTLQHWAHRMYPSYSFQDVLTNIERLGKKKQLQMYMNRYRQGLIEPDQLGNATENFDDNVSKDDEPFDEFDALLREQIAVSSNNLTLPQSNFDDLTIESNITEIPLNDNMISSTPNSTQVDQLIPVQKKLSSEQLARIAENRKLAKEKLRMKRNIIESTQVQSESEFIDEV